MTYTNEVWTSRQQQLRENTTESVARITRTVTLTGLTNAYNGTPFMTVPLGMVALIDEVCITHLNDGGAAANFTVFMKVINVEDQSGQMAAGDSGAAGGVPTGTASTSVQTECPFVFTRTVGAAGNSDFGLDTYVWKLNGDLCIASDPVAYPGTINTDPNSAGNLSAKQASLNFKNTTGATDSVCVHYRLMTRQQAIAKKLFKASFVRATALPITTSTADVVLARKNQSIEINAIAATGNALTTATTEGVRLRFSDNYTVTPSKNFNCWRFLSKSQTAVSQKNNVAVFAANMHMRGPAEYRVTSLGSTNIASTMAVVVVGQYVNGRDADNLPSRGVSGSEDPSKATGTASAGGATTLTVPAGVTLTVNAYAGSLLLITGGTGAGQTRYIASNTAGPPGVITVSSAWTVNPDNTSTFLIYQFKTRHETYEATGVPQQAVTQVQTGLDAFGFERGSKYFWFYTEATTAADEKVFGDTANVANDMTAKLRGYSISADPGATQGTSVCVGAGAGTAAISDFVFASNLGVTSNATKTSSRDTIMSPSVSKSTNISLSRNVGALANLGFTIWGVLQYPLLSTSYLNRTYSGV